MSTSNFYSLQSDGITYKDVKNLYAENTALGNLNMGTVGNKVSALRFSYDSNTTVTMSNTVTFVDISNNKMLNIKETGIYKLYFQLHFLDNDNLTGDDVIIFYLCNSLITNANNAFTISTNAFTQFDTINSALPGMSCPNANDCYQINMTGYCKLPTNKTIYFVSGSDDSTSDNNSYYYKFIMNNPTDIKSNCYYFNITFTVTSVATPYVIFPTFGLAADNAVNSYYTSGSKWMLTKIAEL